MSDWERAAARNLLKSFISAAYDNGFITSPDGAPEIDDIIAGPIFPELMLEVDEVNLALPRSGAAALIFGIMFQVYLLLNPQ